MSKCCTHLTPTDPPTTALCEVLALGDETLMDRAGQNSDAMVSDLVTIVLAGDADPWEASR
jgi:hypothetical protein